MFKISSILRLPIDIKVYKEGKLREIFSYHIFIKRSIILVFLVLFLTLLIRLQYYQPHRKILPSQLQAPTLSAPFNLLPLILQDTLL